jgi:hypothetical protein
MHRGSTLLLKGAVILIAVGALVFCAYVLPIGIRAEDSGAYREILLGLYAPAIPFFIALYQTLLLLGYIDSNMAFSDMSARSLGVIKYCAAAISLLFVAGMPYIYKVAELDDAPGVILIGLIVIFASCVIATAAAVLQRLIQHAVELKAENDLTV